MVGTASVGREGELERLGRALRGDPGAASVAVVTGDAGMGKTRLLTEVLRASPNVLVLAGACLPLSESLPYGAVTDAFAGLAFPSGRPALDRALSWCAPYVGPEMAALIRALSEEPRSHVTTNPGGCGRARCARRLLPVAVVVTRATTRVRPQVRPSTGWPAG